MPTIGIRYYGKPRQLVNIDLLEKPIMFGPRITRVFTSRANALWWSAMVLVTAYCVAIDPPAEVAPAPDTAATAKAEKKEADPWAHINDGDQGQAEKKPDDTWTGLKEAAKKRQEMLH